MSRRHHGRTRHGRGRPDDSARTAAQVDPRPDAITDAIPERGPAALAADAAVAPPPPIVPREPAQVYRGEPPPARLEAVGSELGPIAPGHENGDANGAGRTGCTAPQLRRFIKSRPYVPMHELRRRFGINGAEDEVTALSVDQGSVYVGLPEREGRLLGELVRGGEVGFELSLDPRTPIVVGVYPMRPVPRA